MCARWSSGWDEGGRGEDLGGSSTRTVRVRAGPSGLNAGPGLQEAGMFALLYFFINEKQAIDSYFPWAGLGCTQKKSHK